MFRLGFSKISFQAFSFFQVEKKCGYSAPQKFAVIRILFFLKFILTIFKIIL